MKKSFIILCLIAIIAIPFLYLLLANGYIWFVYPDRVKYKIRGLDISHHPGEINWDEIKKNNFSFIFIKATEGDDHVDGKYEEYIRESSAIGLKTGAYHYYSLRISGKVQAENFINAVKKSGINLPPAIDLEFGGNSRIRPSPQDFEKELNEYIKIIRDYYNLPPIIYTTYDFNKKYLSRINISIEYYLWIRNIFFEPGKLDGRDWTFWQFKSRGRVKGIKGFADINVFRYSEDEFKNIQLK